MPVQPDVLGDYGAAAQGKLRAKLPVERVALRREDRQRVGAALEEHAHEHRLRGADGGCRDSLLERRETELRGAVDGEHRAEPLREERAAGQTGPGGQRHARFDRRQPASGLRGGAVQEARARETGAVAAVVHGHAVWSSGLTAIRCRSAFCVITGYCLRFHDAAPASASADFAKASRAAWVAAVSTGLRQNASAPSSSAAASYGCDAVPGSSEYGRSTLPAIPQRPRHVAVSSQRASSPPATFGG